MSDGFKVSKRYDDGLPREYRKIGNKITIVLRHIYGTYGWSITYMRKGTKKIVNGPWYASDLEQAKAMTRVKEK